MANDESLSVKFVTAGPEKGSFTHADREQLQEQVREWREKFARVKADIQDITSDDLKIRAR